MPEVATAVITNASSPRGTRMSVGENTTINPAFMDPNIHRRVDFHVHLYTVSQRDHQVALPPLIHSLLIKAVAPDEHPQQTRYQKVISLPSPFPQADRDINNGDLIMRWTDARKLAQDICNPNNHSLDQDAAIDEKSMLGIGNNLSGQGVFWSLNDPPTEEEVEKAWARRERHYTGLLEKARTLELSNPKELEFALNRDYHMAADYYAVETTWHRKMIRASNCPNCGETVKPGIAFHRSTELGMICILDWQRAVQAGVKTLSEVPAGKEWWPLEKLPEARLAQASTTAEVVPATVDHKKK